VSTHLPLQSVRLSEHCDPQTPLEQTWPDAHPTPHALQLVLSCGTHCPLHERVPVAQSSIDADAVL
jgi:hypothetical protein